jgi:chromosome segregation ATPase
VSKLENLLSETRNQLYKKNSKIESLEKNLKIAKEKNASQKGSLLALRKASSNSKQLKAEIESLNKKLQSRDKRGYAIFEHKEATLKTWIKGLEDDLASKREYIKSLEIAQKELQEENAKLRAQVAELEKKKSVP